MCVEDRSWPAGGPILAARPIRGGARRRGRRVLGGRRVPWWRTTAARFRAAALRYASSTKPLLSPGDGARKADPSPRSLARSLARSLEAMRREAG